jgi:hypothetical protein
MSTDSDNSDILRGAAEIGAYLRDEIGLHDIDDEDVYYIAKSGKLTIGRWGKELIASKKRISKDLQRAAQAS